MAENELTLNARVGDLERQVAELRGYQAQLNQSVANSNRLTIWQFISFTVVMAGTLFGTLAWISGSLRQEMQQIQRQIEQNERNTNARFDDMKVRFDDMKDRFEDLRQVVLSQQKQPPPKR